MLRVRPAVQDTAVGADVFGVFGVVGAVWLARMPSVQRAAANGAGRQC